MAQDESYWIERAQSAEAKLNTLKQAYEPAIERVQVFKTNFGIREKSNGEIDIDYEQFVKNLGAAAAGELRQVIDETYPPAVKSRKSTQRKKTAVNA